MKGKKDWEESAHALRKVLHELPLWQTRPETSTAGIGRFTNFKFGATYYPRREMWYVYNVMADNIIASLKRTEKGVIMRYRPVSIYAPILSAYNYDRPTFHIPSTNLVKNRSWVRRDVRERTLQTYQSFLEQGGRPRGADSLPPKECTIVIPRVEGASTSFNLGQSTPSQEAIPLLEWRVTVQFDSNETLRRQSNNCVQWLKEMYNDRETLPTHGKFFAYDQKMDFGLLKAVWEDFRNQRRERNHAQIRQEARQPLYSRGVVSSSASTALTDEMLRHYTEIALQTTTYDASSPFGTSTIRSLEEEQTHQSIVEHQQALRDTISPRAVGEWHHELLDRLGAAQQEATPDEA